MGAVRVDASVEHYYDNDVVAMADAQAEPRRGPRFHQQMQCLVEHVTYSFERRYGTVELPDMNCTDMTGCVRFLQTVDPWVKSIEVFVGGFSDVLYKADTSGKWIARQSPKPRR
jgi:hypothetical protein